MKVWLVNPFDPLPGEQEQLGRYAHLANALRQAGHDVLWWSSSFSHRFKRDVQADLVMAAAKSQGIEIRLIPTPRYGRNVSFNRLKSHRSYARSFNEWARNEPPPDIILASSPPLESACAASKLGRAWKVPVIIDIQDQWPDNFRSMMPKAVRWCSGWVLARYYAIEREAYSLATGIVGVAQGYLDRGLHIGGSKKYEGVFPLGVNLKAVDEAIKQGTQRYSEKWRKPDGRVWLLYLGGLGYSHDFLTIVRAAIPAKKRFGERVRFILAGRGELADEAARIVRRHSLDNVTMTGFLEFPEWAYLLSQVDAGFNPSLPGAMIYFPNKIFCYFAAGAAVLNTIPGQCAELIDRHSCGLNYTAGDPASCFDAIVRLVESPDELSAMKAASRRLAEQVYDRGIIYANLTRFLEEAVLG